MSKHLREIFSSAPLPHPLVVQRFWKFESCDKMPANRLTAMTSTRTASVARDEGRSNRRADFVIIVLLRPPASYDRRNLFRSKMDHVRVA
jgi:hypothetical protein